MRLALAARSIVLTLAVAFPAAAQQYFMTVTNHACGPVDLKLLGDVACSDISTGCRFSLPRNDAREIDLSIVQPTDWMALRVHGTCSDGTNSSTMRGTCALPVGRMFIDQGVDATETVLPPGFADRLPLDDDDIALAGDTIQLPPPQTDLTQFRLLLSDCETSDANPAARCKVFCDFPPPLAP
jgi:hypothetical protein